MGRSVQAVANMESGAMAAGQCVNSLHTRNNDFNGRGPPQEFYGNHQSTLVLLANEDAFNPLPWAGINPYAISRLQKRMGLD